MSWAILGQRIYFWAISSVEFVSTVPEFRTGVLQHIKRHNSRFVVSRYFNLSESEVRNWRYNSCQDKGLSSHPPSISTIVEKNPIGGARCWRSTAYNTWQWVSAHASTIALLTINHNFSQQQIPTRYYPTSNNVIHQHHKHSICAHQHSRHRSSSYHVDNPSNIH